MCRTQHNLNMENPDFVDMVKKGNWQSWEERFAKPKTELKRFVLECSSDEEETCKQSASDEEAEDADLEEQDVYLFLDFNNILHQEVLRNPDVSIQITGLEESTPILQINNEIYHGELESAMGTLIVFEEDDGPEVKDEVFSREVPTHVKYVCKTDKVLKMTRIFLKDTERNDSDKESRSDDEPACEEELPETFEEALEELKPYVQNVKTDK